jgi:hypothetical protein
MNSQRDIGGGLTLRLRSSKLEQSNNCDREDTGLHLFKLCNSKF